LRVIRQLITRGWWCNIFDDFFSATIVLHMQPHVRHHWSQPRRFRMKLFEV
jgi:hypothetical protein